MNSVVRKVETAPCRKAKTISISDDGDEAHACRHSAASRPASAGCRRSPRAWARDTSRRTAHRAPPPARRDSRRWPRSSITFTGSSAIISVQAGRPRNIRIAQTSWKRLIGFRPGQVEQLQILQVAEAPAQVALGEIEHGRRVLLPAAHLDRQHAHLVAGAAHQRRLDLVVAHHRPAERRPARQHRQMALVAEGRDPDQALWPQNGPQSPIHQAEPMV